MFLSGGEPLFIDVDRMSVGDPILDLSSVYLFYVGYKALDEKRIEDFMGFSCETAGRFYDSFIWHYLATDDEEVILRTTQKAALFADIRLIGQIRRKGELTDGDRDRIGTLRGEIRSLWERLRGEDTKFTNPVNDKSENP